MHCLCCQTPVPHPKLFPRSGNISCTQLEASTVWSLKNHTCCAACTMLSADVPSGLPAWMPANQPMPAGQMQSSAQAAAGAQAAATGLQHVPCLAMPHQHMSTALGPGMLAPPAAAAAPANVYAHMHRAGSCPQLQLQLAQVQPQLQPAQLQPQLQPPGTHPQLQPQLQPPVSCSTWEMAQPAASLRPPGVPAWPGLAVLDALAVQVRPLKQSSKPQKMLQLEREVRVTHALCLCWAACFV